MEAKSLLIMISLKSMMFTLIRDVIFLSQVQHPGCVSAFYKVNCVI